ncbi:hypothetical protein NA57DRAFT_52350 [Rhizodiscina lignyota]|uniref:BT-1020-like N-terminal beta-propeller domain-containing protein n=1 Tax=Rhizodiscina lignyota TaxID=1504668 RepID=A0A9P4IMR5_9PEZI|nr:hypothetical protein NA57DRAFT_52350 [Rhizodiscina lignyota]
MSSFKMLTTFAVFCLYSLLIPPISASPPPADSYWKVSPPIDVNDRLYAGQPQLPATHKLIYNASQVGRTYAHHTMLRAVGNTVYLIHSTAAVDEDQQSEETWTSVSNDGGETWSETRVLLPQALLPNQTSPEDYIYWCERKVWQRAIAPDSIVEVDGEVYGVGQTAVFMCPDGKNNFRKGAGRIARVIDRYGRPSGGACWVTKNNWTDEVQFDKTVYGQEWGMQWCKHAREIEAILDDPPEIPMDSDYLYNNDFFAIDGKHEMEEVTHGLWIKDRSVRPYGGYWQRFWRDGSDEDLFTGRVWVEYAYDKLGRDWYPKKPESHKIYETNIPDRGSKQYLGRLGNGDRYLVHNPRYNASCFSQCDREPLVVSMSRGSDLSYRSAGVVRTNASSHKIPGMSKNPGFSYPSAVEVDGRLLVGYSENKENIWLTLVDVDNLPGCD